MIQRRRFYGHRRQTTSSGSNRETSGATLLLLIDGSGERRPEPRHGRVSRGVTPDDFGTLETWLSNKLG